MGKKVKLITRRLLNSSLVKVTTRTIINWEKENRPIILLLKKYFSDEELKEFLESGKIEKQELIRDFDKTEINNILKNYHNEKILKEIELLKKQLK